MISPVELHRILAEWRLRLQRAKEILQPAAWNEREWRQFSQALALMVRDHGRSWIIDPNVYWDLRWNLQDGGELVCQIEHIPGEKTSLVVAQNGGFAESVGSYTWLWAEFNVDGGFSRDPYWVEGTWKDALTALLLPLDRQASFLLAGRAETPDSLLLQDGARPNDRTSVPLLPGTNEMGRSTPVKTEEKIVWLSDDPRETAVTEEKKNADEKQAEDIAAASPSPLATPGEEPVVVESKPAGPSSPETGSEKPEVVLNDTVASPPPKATGDTPVETARIPDAPAIQEPRTENSGDGPARPRIDTPAPFAIRWGMPQKLTWKDTDEIAYALIDTFPDQDPLKLSFPKLHKMVVALEDFGDDPEKSSESILESIQMAWYEEVK